ncbi:MAG: hypothetical protein NVV62_09135 [Terricaulis sp.]|nr:hypothetical protein [Terricaulis sp.]
MNFQSGRDRALAAQADYTDQAGAKELKTRIEAFWRERGYDVQVMLVDAPFAAALRAARVDVRSEMVNGLPRRRAEA